MRLYLPPCPPPESQPASRRTATPSNKFSIAVTGITDRTITGAGITGIDTRPVTIGAGTDTTGAGNKAGIVVGVTIVDAG